jgi:hypothetical protein
MEAWDFRALHAADIGSVQPGSGEHIADAPHGDIHKVTGPTQGHVVQPLLAGFIAPNDAGPGPGFGNGARASGPRRS